MITLYRFSNNPSCKKARDWLTSNDLFFVERNLTASPLTLTELKAILQLSENGLNDVFSTQSRVYRIYYNYIHDMSLTDILSFINTHPTILKSPIVIDDKRLVIGYNDSDIRCFIPRHIRKQQLAYDILMVEIRKLYA